MKSIIGGAARKASALATRQNLVEATKSIQHALSGGARRDSAQPKQIDAPAPVVSLRDAQEQENPNPPSLWEAFTPPSLTSAFTLPSFTLPSVAPSPLAPPAAPSPVAPPAAVDASAGSSARKAPPIGEVLNLLQKGLTPVRNPAFAHVRPAPEVPTPEGAQFLSRAYAGPTGSRAYKLFVPSGVSARAGAAGLPLIVMLHGCTQNPDDFALGTGMNELAEKRGCLVAYPQQPTSSNNMACWNWFNLKDQVRGSGEPAIIAGITREIMAEFKVDPDRIFVAGLSAGGAMAAILAATYPDLFAAAGIHSGLPYGAANDVGSAFNSMRKGASPDAALPVDKNVRTIVFHGDADRTVHPSNADLIVNAARAALDATNEKTHQGRSAGGVPYKRTVIAAKRGAPHVEYWQLEGMGHAWSGGHPEGSYTNPHGPDASREMMRFFLD